MIKVDTIGTDISTMSAARSGGLTTTLVSLPF